MKIQRKLPNIRKGEQKIVNELMESMKANQSGPLQRIAILCLVQLSKNKKLREIIQTKAVSLIIQARNKYMDVPHIHRVASAAVETLVSASASTAVAVPKGGISKEMESLQLELKKLQENFTEKEGTINELQKAVEQLEQEFSSGKEGLNLESFNEIVQKIGSKKEIVKLKQQRQALIKELKRVQAESEEVSATLESVTRQLKEEEKKLKDPKKSINIDLNKKQEKNVQNTEKKKRETKHGTKKNKGNISPTSRTNNKRNGNQKSKTGKHLDKSRKGNGSPTEKASSESDSDSANESTLRSVMQSQSNSLRSYSRRLSSAVGGSGVNTEVEVIILNGQIDETQNLIEEKNNEKQIILEQKNKIDEVVNKLSTDLKGTHILIQTLQKESLNQTHNREKLVTGNSLFARHQKKLKSTKDQIANAEKENEELKREIAALGGEPSLSITIDKSSKKKKKHII